MIQGSKSFKDSELYKQLITVIKNKLVDNDHETFPYIGSLANCLMLLEVKDRTLWDLLEEKINED